MERKIGEIFEYNGEWYQVVECSKDNYHCIGCCGCKGVGGARINGGECNGNARNDRKFVIFKKLEKVGEPMKIHNRLVLKVKADAYNCMRCCFYSKAKCELTIQECERYDCGEGTKFIEINKEDMEEKKLNLKPFDIQKAREGKPVCTRDGRKARIICFDYTGETGDYPIVALVSYNKGDNCYERVLKYTSNGLFNKYGDYKHDDDLMMLPEKKEGWVNVYNADTTFYYVDGMVYNTKDEAIQKAKEEITTEQREKSEYVDTVKINWEE